MRASPRSWRSARPDTRGTVPRFLHLSEIVDGVEKRHDRVLLTRNGRPAAIILSPDDLEALEATLDILSDPKAMREIRKAECDVEAGHVVTGDELRSKYLKRK